MIAYQIVFYWNVECLKWIFEFLVTVFSYNLKQGFINYLLQLYATTSSSAIVGGCTHLALSTWGRTLNRWSAAVLILCVSMNQSRAPSLPTALSVSFEERKIITERERESDGLVWMGLGWYFFYEVAAAERRLYIIYDLWVNKSEGCVFPLVLI